MKIDRPDFRKRFIGITCEWCGRHARDGTDPAHLFKRSGGWLDLRWNLTSQHRMCHAATEESPESQARLAVIVAKRERTTPAAIIEALYFWRRAKKGMTKEMLEATLAKADMTKAGRSLVARDLEELRLEGFFGEVPPPVAKAKAITDRVEF
jgi:hypothetical protein